MKKFIKTGALTAAVLLTGVVSAVSAVAFPAFSGADKTAAWKGMPGNAAFVDMTDNNDAAVDFSAEAEMAAVLKQGSKGGEVKEVQRRLKQRHENNGGVFQRGDDGRVRRVQGGHRAASGKRARPAAEKPAENAPPAD